MNSSDNYARYKEHTVYEARRLHRTPNMIDIGQTKVAAGRYINDGDYTHESMVCFVGQDVVDAFFPNVDPLDKEIRIDGFPSGSSGTGRRLGSMFG